MHRSHLVLTALFALTFCQCSHGKPEAPPPDFKWPAGVGQLPPATGVTYAAGTPSPLASATIGVAGGTLEGPVGTVLEGVVVTFPMGALLADTTFTLGTDNGAFAYDGGEFTNPIIALLSDGQTSFERPITVTFPFPDASKIPVPYYLAPDGSIELAQPLNVDRAAQRGGFATWHASNYTWVNKDTRSPNPVFNGFRPEIDGFAFSNTKANPYAPNGRCWGISTFTKWYKRTHGGGLYSKYTREIPTHTSRKESLTEQEIIATRAQLAVSLYNTGTSGVDQGPAILAVMDALRKGATAVMVGLGSPKGNHAVLAIGFSDNQIAVYDSNHPGVTKAIDYTLSLTEDAPSTISYGPYDVMDVWGNGDLPLAEPLATILRDADASFNNENQTDIEITSHQSNQHVNSQDIVLEGKVHSGEVSIAELEAKVVYEDLTTSEPQKVSLAPGHEEFSVPLKLRAGDNYVFFTTRGYLVHGQGLRDIPNDRDGNENALEPFVLTWGEQATPNNLLTLSSSRTVISGTTKRVDKVELSAPFSYFVNPGLPAVLASPSFTWSNCTGSGGCIIVDGRTYAGSIDGNWLPIEVNSNHSERYDKDPQTGEWKLTSTSDEPRTVTCEWISIKLFVEPGSTAGNYQYRLALARAGNIRCPSMQNHLPLIGLSLELEDSAESCESPPLVMPAQIEEWAKTPVGAKSFSLSGSVNCSDGENSQTESATVSITLTPCGGAPCLR